MSQLPHPPKLSDRGRLGWYLLFASAIAIGAVGVIAAVLHQPWVFPSLGPTAFIVFASPLAAAASPRNVLTGHLIAILAGVLALLAVGLYGQAPDLEDMTWQRVVAVMIALALTLATMTWLGVPHAPAGATTLIVALGLISDPVDFAVMMLAVVVLIVVAMVINRIHGVKTPYWAPRPEASEGSA